MKHRCWRAIGGKRSPIRMACWQGVGGLATVRAAPVSVPQIAGSPVQMRYVIVVNTSSGNRLIGFWDIGAAQYFQVGFSITLGDAPSWPVLTLQ